MTPVPEDPDDWTDEEWLAWLDEGDAAGAGRRPAVPPRTAPSWRSAGFGTQMLAAAMLGVAEALNGPKEEPAIVVDASGDPPGDNPLDLHLDPDRPDHSVVVVRPWLLRQRDGDAS